MLCLVYTCWMPALRSSQIWSRPIYFSQCGLWLRLDDMVSEILKSSSAAILGQGSANSPSDENIQLSFQSYSQRLSNDVLWMERMKSHRRPTWRRNKGNWLGGGGVRGCWPHAESNTGSAGPGRRLCTPIQRFFLLLCDDTFIVHGLCNMRT